MRRRARGRIRLWWSSEGDGDAVVLLMGLGLASSAWGATATRLRERHRVLVVDNPGAGQSPGARARLTTSSLADAVVAVLDAASISSAHVYGVSLGGMVAQELALRHPARVRSLILGCTLAGGAAARLPDRRLLAPLLGLPSLQRGAGTRYTGRLLVSEEFRIANDARAAELASAAFQDASSIPATLQQLAAVLTHEARQRLPFLRTPTLVLHGTADLLVPVANARMLASVIPGAQLRLYAGAGHAYLLEAEDQALRDVEAFIADCRAGVPDGSDPLDQGSVTAQRRGESPVHRLPPSPAGDAGQR